MNTIPMARQVNALPPRRPVVLAYLAGALVTAVFGHFLLDLPIQLTDSYGNMLMLEQPWGELLKREFYQTAFLRPFLRAELKLVYDLADGNYSPWYRWVHVLQLATLVFLFLKLVRPRTYGDAAIVPLGLGVLVGMHTFTGTVMEAFPINTYLTILLCCFLAALVALGEYRWWNDLLAIALFWVAVLTVESGLLVWVIFVGAAIVGARGLSRVGIGAMVAMLIGYFALRFVLLDIGTPGLEERSSGYGFRALDPPELIERFGENPLPFYLYNILTSLLSVLVAEPRAGVFRLTAGFVESQPEPALIIASLASIAAVVAIGAYAWRRRSAWLAWRFERDDQLVLVFGAVLAANAVISYPYTKDVIMSPAGGFFALAVFVSVRHLIAHPPPGRTVVAVASIVLCAVLSCTWSIRAASNLLVLREAAFNVRNEWAYVETWLEQEGYPRVGRPAELADYLRTEAILRRPEPPRLRLPMAYLFDVD